MQLESCWQDYDLNQVNLDQKSLGRRHLTPLSGLINSLQCQLCECWLVYERVLTKCYQHLFHACYMLTNQDAQIITTISAWGQRHTGQR